jgi:ubiquinone/menaquinone biosynthesis C-methylase UbiE
MGVRNIVKDYAEAITQVNVSRGVSSDSMAAVGLKQRIAAMYDANAARPLMGAMWNWGACDERIDRRIRASIPHYDKYETDGFSEQLYYMALDVVPVDPDGYRDKTVVEVGCGLGEGLSFLSRLVPARSFIGLDLSTAAIERANSKLSREGLIFIRGDAERLPFADGDVDVLINVESSHIYPDLRAFMREVVRVLKRGGYFSHTDVFTTERHTLMEKLKREIPGLEWEREIDVTPYVQAAIRRRLERQSVLRRRFREKRHRAILDRLLGERGLMAAYGARFAGYEFSPFWKLLNRALLPRKEPLRYVSYRLSLARKC